eukprot:CAMPEP_0119487088 /NCGR_PEP_ID=MMETSP1344-20130328/13281_1 /TAXON_ID=236787 /ORGANISM="Florenciella parvula, Strain CCMP2471" /LENGTH=37 /DNA_ID= /DNA_START= /DNA_END= /DNA_ORIENTATION=
MVDAGAALDAAAAAEGGGRAGMASPAFSSASASASAV